MGEWANLLRPARRRTWAPGPMLTRKCRFVNRLRHLIVIETDVGELVLGAAPGLNKDVPRLLFAAGLHKLIQYRAERTPSVRSSHGASNLNQFLFVASQVDLLPGYGFVLFLLRARYV